MHLQSFQPFSIEGAQAFSAFICFPSFNVFSSSLVMKDLVEVCTLSCWVSPPSGGPILLITSRLSLSPLSHARCPNRSPYGFPASLKAEHRVYHVPFDPHDRLGSLSSPAVSDPIRLPMTRKTSVLVPTASPFWLKPLASHLQLVPLTTFIECSHLLTILPTLALSPGCIWGAFRLAVPCQPLVVGALSTVLRWTV